MKKNYNIGSKVLALFSCAIALALVVNSCDPYEITYETTSDQLIGEYLETDSTCSMFWELAELSGNSSFIKAYGAYTCFAPTDSAFSQYLTEQGKSSLSEFSDEELEDLFEYHMISDTIRTSDFTDGKMSTASMNGRYITSGATIEGTTAYYTLNKEALITEADVELGNGILHVIDNVLDPPSKSVGEMIEENSDYSIFTEALKATGIYDVINNEDSWYTVFLESNSIYTSDSVQIYSYDDLYDKYCNTGDPTNTSDSLYLYMAYHVLNSCSYMADLIQESAIVTLAENEVITVIDESDSIIINQTTIAGTTYPGANVIEDNSDNICLNGVFHELDGDIYIRVLSPTAVFWDPTSQSEMEALTGIYKSNITSTYFDTDALSEVDFGGTNTTIGYEAEGSCIDGDMLSVYLRTAVIPWVEFQTPVLIKGTYKLWVAFRANPYGNTIQTTWNGEELTKLFDIGTYGQTFSSIDEDEYYALGYKWYSEVSMSSTRVCCVYVGKVEVTSTGQQTLRFDALTNSRGVSWLDQIQFIPEDDSQIWPKFDADGNKLYEEDLPDFYEDDEEEEVVE